MALAPAPEGSPAARFAALLRHHMRVGTRPAGKRGSGAWGPDGIAHEIGVSRRTIDNYGNGSTLPPDATPIADALFSADPRHAAARTAFLIAFAEATGTEPPPWIFAVSNIPVRVPTHFIGRNESLAAIRTALGRYPGQVAISALHGLRGVGKTVLAAAYAERHRAEYRATWWVRAQTEPTMRADLIALGVRLGWIDADEKEEPSLVKVVERLRYEGDGILLIFDNALDARHVASFLPRGGAAEVLVTSNAHNWRGVAEPVEITLWPKATGADYLIACTGRTAERADAEILSEVLGGLPLAHEQAAAYCERLGITLAEYVQRFAVAPARLLDDRRHAPAEYHDGLTVAKTFGLAIAEAAKQHSAAEPLIAHLALLAPEAIPLFLFDEGRMELGEPLAALLVENELDEAVAVLRTFALVQREMIADERAPESTIDTVRLHRLVREVVTARLSVAARHAMQRRLLVALAAVYPVDEILRNQRTWPRARRLDPIGMALVGFESTLVEGSEEAAAELLTGLALYRQGVLAAYAQARPLFERALAIREAALGVRHHETAASFHYLAALLQLQGDLAGAQPLYERALAISEATLGPEHRNTATTLHDLARLLEDGDPAGAQPLYERALAIYEKVLGPDHSDTATCLTNLARVLQAQGDLVGARPLYERALAIYEKEESPLTGLSLHNLGSLLRVQGDLVGARSHYERALAICEKALGAEHPSTATTLHDLAGLHWSEGDVAGARLRFERALVIYEKVLGPDHPDAATCVNNLGHLLQVQGDLAGARLLFDRALATREEALGAEHPGTAASVAGLAGLLQAQGDLAGAQTLFERALAIREAALGAENPATASSLHGLAGLLQAQGDLAGAQPLFERALAIREAAFGAESPVTAASLHGLAGLLQAQGDLAGAQTLFERALAIREAGLGAESPATAASLHGLAGLLQAQGDLARAQTLFERALAIREAALGVGHPDTAASLHGLAGLLQAQGRSDWSTTAI